jgi:dTDP-4-amino-4,6-dideoxygalactose transaminase
VVIPFNRPAVAGKELDFIKQAIATGRLAGDGEFTDRCQNWLAEMVGAKAVLLTHSCTAALEMAGILIGLEAGDEVIMPSFTFVSTANAVVLRGAIPVFVDVRPDTLNINEDLVETAITERTKAIVPIHYAGVIAEMDHLLKLAQKRGLWLIEDAAQALGSRYKGRAGGSFGHLATFSFHETKNMVSGEGGALAVNDTSLVERAEIIRDKGTNRKKFFRGHVDKYTWVDIGSSYLPSELIASYLYAQLLEADTIQRDRSAHWHAYEAALRAYRDRGVQVPTIPPTCQHNAHLFYIILPTPELQSELILRMRQDGITTPFHYVPLHSSPAGRKYARVSGNLKHTEDLSARLLRLPLYPQMGSAVDKVIERLQIHLDSLL